MGHLQTAQNMPSWAGWRHKDHIDANNYEHWGWARSSKKASQVEAPQDLCIVIPTQNNTQTHFVEDSTEWEKNAWCLTFDIAWFGLFAHTPPTFLQEKRTCPLFPAPQPQAMWWNMEEACQNGKDFIPCMPSHASNLQGVTLHPESLDGSSQQLWRLHVRWAFVWSVFVLC